MSLGGGYDLIKTLPVKWELLFIDGNHSEAGVEQDYRHLVRPGGIIAFHDIVEHQPLSGNQVRSFRQRLRAEAETEEFVADSGLCGFGIGTIRVPE
ncbi:MAG TPA: hypothetical protein ENJ19_10245 [Gammaproteobacteria bacterium]|nr:hypothetical protein [Gammaproteobacteria bacterium]